MSTINEYEIDGEFTVGGYLKAILEDMKSLNLFCLIMIVCLPSFLINRALLKQRYYAELDLIVSLMAICVIGSEKTSNWLCLWMLIGPTLICQYLKYRRKHFYDSLRKLGTKE